MSRLRYVAKRCVILVLLILGIASALFFFFRALPGDYATLVIQSGASEAQVEALRQRWGLDDPLYVQYLRFLTNLLTGDMGDSRVYGIPVMELVIPRLMNSLILAGPAIVTAYLIGSLYGALMGNKPGSLLEKYGIIPPTMFGTTPDFFIGILLIFVFGATLDILPNGGMISLETYRVLGQNPSNLEIYSTWDFWLHYILPFSAIVLKYLYFPTLIMRSSIVDVRGQEFAYYHRIKGLSRGTRLRHLMKHASFPVITLFPVSMTRAISGLILIEIVFNWPGLGKLLLDSVIARDIPVIQFVYLLVAIWVVVANFGIDLLYGIIDPRVSVEGDES